MERVNVREFYDVVLESLLQDIAFQACFGVAIKARHNDLQDSSDRRQHSSFVLLYLLFGIIGAWNKGQHGTQEIYRMPQIHSREGMTDQKRQEVLQNLCP
jgi:hypothetical protein